MQTRPELFCYQYPAEPGYGMYFSCDQNFGRDYMMFYKCSYIASRPAQLGWAQFAYQHCASQYLWFLKQHETALCTTVKISVKSWRQIQMNRQYILITNRKLLSVMDGNVCHAGII